ncbi:hypothetical protein QNM99_27900 [Pseudomonas sp. PCH446]
MRGDEIKRPVSGMEPVLDAAWLCREAQLDLYRLEQGADERGHCGSGAYRSPYRREVFSGLAGLFADESCSHNDVCRVESLRVLNRYRVGAELAREAFSGLAGLFADESCSHNDVCRVESLRALNRYRVGAELAREAFMALRASSRMNPAPTMMCVESRVCVR